MGVSPADRIRAEIDALFAGDRDLGEVVEDVARLEELRATMAAFPGCVGLGIAHRGAVVVAPGWRRVEPLAAGDEQGSAVLAHPDAHPHMLDDMLDDRCYPLP